MRCSTLGVNLFDSVSVGRGLTGLQGVPMFVFVLLGTIWLMSGCVGAILLDGDEAGPINFSNIALGPVALVLGIMVVTEARD